MCTCLSTSGDSFRPGEEEDEEEGRQILNADESDCCHLEASATCGPEHLCSWRAGPHLAS